MVRIAVVNDDTDFLHLMGELLREQGWEVTVHIEGRSAYPILRDTCPDLIILDVRMDHPEAGWHLLEMLTLDPETRGIPVIVCSAALDDLRSREGWLRQHGIGTLPKPFDIDDLYSTVEAALARTPPEA